MEQRRSKPRSAPAPSVPPLGLLPEARGGEGLAWVTAWVPDPQVVAENTTWARRPGLEQAPAEGRGAVMTRGCREVSQRGRATAACGPQASHPLNQLQALVATRGNGEESECGTGGGVGRPLETALSFVTRRPLLPGPRRRRGALCKWFTIRRERNTSNGPL